MSGGTEFSGGDWGWVVAIAASTWAVVLRFVIGHYVKIGERLEKRLEKIEERLSGVEARLAVIEQRSYRVRGDR